MREVREHEVMARLIQSSHFNNCFTRNVENDVRLFHFKDGGMIVKEGCKPDYIFYLAKGRAKLYSSVSNGRISLIDFFNQPCFIGEMELIDENHIPRAVQALEECWCLALPISKYRAMLLNDVTFLRHLCYSLSQKNYRNISVLTQNQSFPLINRLSAFILLSQHEGIYREKHTQVAEYMGVSYRHLLYVIAQLNKNNVLIKNERGYAINDYDSLVKLACEMDVNFKFSSVSMLSE